MRKRLALVRARWLAGFGENQQNISGIGVELCGRIFPATDRIVQLREQSIGGRSAMRPRGVRRRHGRIECFGGRSKNYAGGQQHQEKTPSDEQQFSVGYGYSNWHPSASS